MSPDEALEHARRFGVQHRVFPTRHGQQRMSARNVLPADVKACIATATSAVWDAQEETWRLKGGKDFDGEGLDVVVTVEVDCLRVVTVIPA